MKKIIQSILIFIFVFSSQTIFAESIERYHVDMLLNKDSSVDITETIYYDFGENNKHGIFRFIPVNFNVKGQQKWGGLKERKLKFSNLLVTRDGSPENFIKEDKDSSGNYYIKIGDANKTINGIHHYEIKYTVNGSLRYFDDVDEIYWNAIGLDWKVPIKNATVGLRKSDREILFGETSCYIGSLESNKSCKKIEKYDDVILFSNYSFDEGEFSLKTGEGLTIAAALQEKGMVYKNELYGFSTKGFVLGGIALFIIFIIGLIYSGRKYLNKYKIYDPIYPRYEPPQGFSPVAVGYLLDKRFDGRDITAGIISLAQHGYLHIEQTKSGFLEVKDYIFTLLKDPIDNNNLFDKTLIDLIFDGKQEPVKLSKVSKKNAIIAKQKLVKDINSFFLEEGYIEDILKNNSFKKIPIIFIIFFVFTIFKSFIPFVSSVSIFILIILSVLGITTLTILPKRYTSLGWKTKNNIDGFKDFLSMTEKDRYEVLNNPADNPQEFMEYLPYAIAMGVEEKWAKQFESITIENPKWYSGVNTFNTVVFASHLSSLNNSLTSTSTVSSSGSGSSDGGFSGGGSGGGGGGSW